MLREKVQRQPIEAAEANRLAWYRGLPGDFDVRLIIWREEFSIPVPDTTFRLGS